MYRPIKRLLTLQDNDLIRGDCIGLVIGAGGTARAACYAIQQLGKY